MRDDLRGLLLSLATENDLGVLGPLADLLEEQGDPRAAKVRCPPRYAEPHYVAAAVLVLFPEGPRWAASIPGGRKIKNPHLGSSPCFLSPASASRVYFSVAVGPFWPEDREGMT